MAKILTDTSIRKFKPDASKRREIPDPKSEGLHLVLQLTGKMSWELRFRRPDGRSAEVTLGHFDDTGRAGVARPIIGGPLTESEARFLAAKIIHEQDHSRARGRRGHGRRLCEAEATSSGIVRASAPCASENPDREPCGSRPVDGQSHENLSFERIRMEDRRSPKGLITKVSTDASPSSPEQLLADDFRCWLEFAAGIIEASGEKPEQYWTLAESNTLDHVCLAAKVIKQIKKIEASVPLVKRNPAQFPVVLHEAMLLSHLVHRLTIVDNERSIAGDIGRRKYLEERRATETKRRRFGTRRS
jgi:hypothetical protein